MAIDTEFHLEKTYYIQLALVQVAVEGEAYCVDPIALRGRLGPLFDVVCDPAVQKLLHAASMDLRVFFEHSSRPAANIFDTQIAAGLLGHGVSAYGEVVEMCCGVKLPKGATMSDWLKRPLDDDQLRYAEDDVTYLGAVADELAKQLHERGRFEWFEQECARLETRQYYDEMMRNPRELFPRVKKVKSLDPEQRAKAYRLLEWREQEAALQDKPPYFLLKDQALTEIARLTPSSAEELLEQGSRVVHPNLAKYNGKAIVELLNAPPTQQELSLCDELLSRPSAPVEATKMELAKATAVFSLLYAYFLNVCAAQDIEPQFVASQANLKYLVTEAVTGQLQLETIGPEGILPAHAEGVTSAGAATEVVPHHQILTGWRWNIVGRSILQFMKGDVSVSYDPSARTPIFTSR